MGTLDQKRVMIVYPLTPDRVKEIVLEVGKQSGVTWESGELDRIIKAFTDEPEAGMGRRDVNLLGLQVVLKSLFSALEKDGKRLIDRDRIRQLCASVTGLEDVPEPIDLQEWLELQEDEGEDGRRKVRAPRLVAEAPRRWIERSLSEERSEDDDVSPLPSDVKEGEYEPALIKMMVARMSAWLVTPAGFKRPMTGGELHGIAYESDLNKIREGDLAGRAIRDGLSLADGSLKERLEKTFAVALHRLVEVGHILKGRGSDRDASYELVHDQFGKPLQAWASAFLRTPDANLGSLYAIDNDRFGWGREKQEGPLVALSAHIKPVDGRRVLEFAKWRGCTLCGIDFSGIVVSACDFGRCEFVECSFDESTSFSGDSNLSGALFRNCLVKGTKFEGGVLRSALFETCRVEGATFENCALDGAEWRGKKSSLRGVRFVGGTMTACIVNGIEMSDCTFAGKADRELSLWNAQLVNIAFSGETRFEFCSLDGATIGIQGGEADAVEASMLRPGNMTFTDCALKGAEFEGLDFGSHSLTFSRCEARGAVFTEISFDLDGSGRATFGDVDLTGAVFVGCRLPRACFAGDRRLREETGPDSATPCKTIVIKGLPGLPALLVGARFSRLDMENFTFSECELRGDIEFDDCELSGGTIKASPDSESGARKVLGNLRFRNDCDLAAVELSGLDFSDGSLELTDCRAPSLRLQGINLPSRPGGAPRASLVGCHSPGLLFQDCVVHGLEVRGSEARPRPSVAALIVRGDRLRSFGDCSFRDVDLENFTFENVEIDGHLEFRNCSLAGGSIAGASATSEAEESGRTALIVQADLRFTEGCNVRAVEIRTVDFEGGRLLVSDSACDGMILIDVLARSLGGRPVIEMTRTSLEGVVLDGCNISGLVVSGLRTESSLTGGQGMTVRSNERPMRLGNATLEDLDLDGLVMDDVTVDGSITFARCTLLRSRFTRIRPLTDRDFIDVSETDLLFSQIDEQILASVKTSSPVLRMGDGQLDGALKAAGALKHMRYKVKQDLGSSVEQH